MLNFVQRSAPPTILVSSTPQVDLRVKRAFLVPNPRGRLGACNAPPPVAEEGAWNGAAAQSGAAATRHAASMRRSGPQSLPPKARAARSYREIFRSRPSIYDGTRDCNGVRAYAGTALPPYRPAPASAPSSGKWWNIMSFSASSWRWCILSRCTCLPWLAEGGGSM